MTDIDDTANIEQPIESVEKPKQIRVKKPRTEKQIKQFESLCKSKRTDNIKESKKLKKLEASKLLLENEYEIKPKVAPVVPSSPSPTSPDSDESDNEPTIIIKKKKKPRKKTIIIEESDSDEESVEYVRPKERKFVTQQNQKSVVKIHHKSVPNYFAD